MTRQRRRVTGQALAEFALVVPFFLLLLFGIIDLGRMVYAANAVSNGAREAARAGSVSNRPPECAGMGREACVVAVSQSHAWGLPSDAVDTVVTCERWPVGSSTPTAIGVGQCRTSDLLTVHSETQFELLTPLIGQFVGSFPLVGESKVTVQQ
jgi:hypothetical protein